MWVRNVVVWLAVRCCLFANVTVNGFVIITTTTVVANKGEGQRDHDGSSSPTQIGVFRRDGVSVSSSLDEETTTTTTNDVVDRRGILFMGTSFAVASAWKKTNNGASSVAFFSSSVEDALRMIADSCDRRFLREVVAADYRLLYRGTTITDGASASAVVVKDEPSDLLSPSTYAHDGSTGDAAAAFFAALDERMRDVPVRPSNGHLGTTNAAAARRWGGAACSVWPLTSSSSSSSKDRADSAYFAWPRTGGDFWTDGAENNAATFEVIVDGVDCRAESLEDALRGPSNEILFRADGGWLAVPETMSENLVAGLKRSFLL